MNNDDPPLITHVKYGEFKPVECPVCGKNHPPIECLAKALGGKPLFASSELITVGSQKLPSGMPLLMIPGHIGKLPSFLAKLFQQHPPGCQCGASHNPLKELPPVRLRTRLMYAGVAKKLLEEKGMKACCKQCRAQGVCNEFLDYVYCPQCNKALSNGSVSLEGRTG